MATKLEAIETYGQHELLTNILIIHSNKKKPTTKTIENETQCNIPPRK